MDNPRPDLFLAGWWTIDVFLAWTVWSENQFVKFQRGVVHLLAFIMFFGAMVLAPKAGVVVHVLGIIMMIAVLICIAIRIVVPQSDPHSFAMQLFVWSFTALNKIAAWHRLPSFIGVINLAALREVLRAENLHNTSDIPVTRLEGLEATPLMEPRDLVRRNEDGSPKPTPAPVLAEISPYKRSARRSAR